MFRDAKQVFTVTLICSNTHIFITANVCFKSQNTKYNHYNFNFL